MQHSNTLDLKQSVLLIIDMQEAFRTKIPHFPVVAERIAVLVRAAKLLNFPIIITEQYPKGLGHTALEIKNALPAELSVMEKTSFSSCGAQTFERELLKTGARQVLACGIEAHICVNQTVHDLLAANYQVHLITDCITSRHPDNKEIGLRKMRQSGAIPSSVEMALFELLRDAKHEQFKAIQGLIK